MIWKNLSVDIDPTKWGWKLDGKSLQPLMTDLEPAPEFIIKFIRCKCKLSARSPCSSNVCSCRKHGLKCVSACGDCHGQQTARTLKYFLNIQIKYKLYVISNFSICAVAVAILNKLVHLCNANY